MILFKTIRWMNFLSTGNSWTEVQLDRSKSTLIVGDNGAGKSTILDALAFGLYGKPFRRINKGQLMNSINKKALRVEVEFQIGSSKFKVIRGIKPNKFEVYRNGDLLNQDAAARDYQETLEKQILKLNHKSFCQVVVLGSATFTPFMQLPANHRREVIEDLLDIQIFSTMNALLKEKIQTNKDDLNKAEYHFDLTKEKILMQNKHTDALKESIDKSIVKKEADIEKYNKLIGECNDEIEATSKEIQSLNEEITDKESVEKKISKIHALEGSLEDKILKLKKEIKFYGNHDNCPTCKQGIDSDFKHQTLEENEKRLAEAEEGQTKLHEEYQKAVERLSEVNVVVSRITELNSSITSKNATIAAHNNSIKGVEAEIQSLNEEKDNVGTDADVTELESKLDIISKAREKLSNEKQLLATAALLLRDGGIKTRIIKQYIPVINKLINKYLAAMDFFVHFELDENFNETIKSRFRDDFSYASFSEGEKMRIDLSLLFAWRAVAKIKNSISTNLLILDEVFDSSLDTGGTEEFLKILNTLTGDANVFIISHKGDQLFDKFHSVIKFEKHKNFSRIAA